MEKEKYTQIKEYLRDLIKGTEKEWHVFAADSCLCDETMGQEVKGLFDTMLTSHHPAMAMELLRKTRAMHYIIPELEEKLRWCRKSFTLVRFGIIRWL